MSEKKIFFVSSASCTFEPDHIGYDVAPGIAQHMRLIKGKKKERRENNNKK